MEFLKSCFLHYMRTWRFFVGFFLFFLTIAFLKTFFQLYIILQYPLSKINKNSFILIEWVTCWKFEFLYNALPRIVTEQFMDKNLPNHFVINYFAYKTEA